MIEGLTAILPIVIYFLLIVLLIVVIVLGIKLIITVDTLNKIIADVQSKVESLNSIFKFTNLLADNLSKLGSKVVDTVTRSFSKILDVGKRKDEDDYE